MVNDYYDGLMFMEYFVPSNAIEWELTWGYLNLYKY